MISRFVGFSYDNKEILKKMSMTMVKNGENKEVSYLDNNFNLMSRYINNKESINIKYYIDETNYIIVILDGILFNKEELLNLLKSFDSDLDNEINYDDCLIIAKMYNLFNEKMLNYLNGYFSICIYEKNKNKIFLARDHFGTKPLFYSLINNNIIFASEIKALLVNDNISHIVDKNGISMLLGIGPARIPGTTVYRDIKEIKPGHYAIYENNEFKEEEYFKIRSYEHTDSIEDTCKRLKYFLTNSIYTKVKSLNNYNVGTFLSGGLDSSIVTRILSNYYTNLKSFSVDYIDNNKNFKSSKFIPERDNYYIDILKKELNLDHKYIINDNYMLYEKLYEALKARDVPSMADIDSSLLLLCNEVKNDANVIFSGEFADEIFCSYPWFYNNENITSNTFPFSNSIDLRENLISETIKDKINLNEYINNIFNEAINNIPLDETKSEEDKDSKILSYLTMYYFGENLIERNERMSSNSSIEILTPFIDYRLVEYVYNIPWKYKNLNNKEKGILRETFKHLLPNEIINRKKSPYPKTFSLDYERIVKNKLLDIINNKDNYIQKIINIEYVRKIINMDNNEFNIPWFGQLMKRPQLMAYLIQLEMWIKEYNIVFDI